jgi:hypothetical protein
MGSAQGRGVRELQASQGVGKIGSQLPARKGTTWRRKKKEGREGVMKKSQHAQSGHFSRRLFVAV